MIESLFISFSRNLNLFLFLNVKYYRHRQLNAQANEKESNRQDLHCKGCWLSNQKTETVGMFGPRNISPATCADLQYEAGRMCKVIYHVSMWPGGLV